MRPPEFIRAVLNLIKWSDREPWSERRIDLLDQHIRGVVMDFDISGERIADLLDEEDMSRLVGFVMEHFSTVRFGEDGELNEIDAYIEKHGWRESVQGKRYLEALRDSTASLYEVIEVVPGRTLKVRDLLRGGDGIVVEDPAGESIVRWDCIAGHLVTVSGKVWLADAMLLMHPIVADLTREDFEAMVNDAKQYIRRELERQGATEEELEDAARDLFFSDRSVYLTLSDAGCRTF